MTTVKNGLKKLEILLKSLNKRMNESVKSAIERFSQLVRNKFTPQIKIILFGSYVKDKQKKWSDIDLAVIIPEVKDVFDVEKSLRLLSLKIDERINPLVFTQKDMEETSPFVWEIKRYGKEV